MPILIAAALFIGSGVLGDAVGYPLLVPLAMVVATTFWVHSDSNEIDYPDSGIEAKVLLLWIIFFPYYLYQRREVKIANAVSERLSEERVTDMRMHSSVSPSTHSAASSPSERACPECGETVLAVARKCKHCGSAIEPIAEMPAVTGSPHADSSPATSIGAAAGRPVGADTDESESSGAKKIFIGIAVVVVALGALLWFASTHKGDPPSDAGTASNTEPALAVGDLITTSKLGIKVSSVDTPDAVGVEFMRETPAEGGKYVAVQWEYQNISAKPIGMFGQPRLYLADPSGTRYEADVGASSAYAMQLDLTEKVLSDLNPGIKVRAASVFEVAETLLERPGWTIEIVADRTIKIPLMSREPEPAAVARSEAPAADDAVVADAVAAADESATAAEPAASPYIGDWQSVGPLPDGEDSFSIRISESNGALRAAYGSGGPFSESLRVVEADGGLDLYFDYIEGSAEFNESFDAERKSNDESCKVKIASARPADDGSLVVTTHEDPCGLMPSASTVTLRKPSE